MDDNKPLPQFANSINDKVLILQARDKYVRSHRKKQTDIETAKIVSGSCKDMCPEYERYCRIDRDFVSILERTNGEPDEYKFIKEYVRSGADQEEPLPYELRPTEVLERTMLYLTTNIINLIDEEENIDEGVWYEFLWNRLRAIKKDITQQDLKSLSSVFLIERCARFHIFSGHRLIELDRCSFDPKMNDENLTKSIQSLKDLYDDLSLNGIHCPNEAEFRCYDILMNLCNRDFLKLSKEISNYRKLLRDSEPIKFAIKVFVAFNNNNFVLFFNLMKETTFLNACILHRYFGPMRYLAFQLLRRAFTTANQREVLSKHHIFDQLCFEEEEEFDNFCDLINIEVDDDNVILKKDTMSPLPNHFKSRRSVEYIDAKMGKKKISEIIYNEQITDNPFRKYLLQNSFDENGQLIETEIKLDSETTVKINQKAINIFAESKISSGLNKPKISTTNVHQHTLIGNNNPFSAPTTSTNLFSAPTTSTNLFSTPTTSINLFSAPTTSTNLFSAPTTSINLFSAPTTSTNLFSAPTTSINLFSAPTTSTNLFSAPTTSTNLFSKSQDLQQNSNKGPNFHFKIPLSMEQTNQTSSNLFSSSNLQNSTKLTFSFKIPEPTSTQEKENLKEKKDCISDEEKSSINKSIFQNLLDDVLEDLVGKAILKILINDQVVKFTNLIMNECLDELINEICRSVYNQEKNRQKDLKINISLISSEICNLIINEQLNELANSISKDIYLKELNQFIYSKSELIANSYFEETLEQLVLEICSFQYLKELKDHQRIVNYIKEKRGWRLAKNFFNHWKKRCDYLKRYRFLKENFPASRMEKSPPILKRVISVPELTNEPLAKRKLVEQKNQSLNANLSKIITPFALSRSQSTRSSVYLDLDKESRIQEELKEIQEQFKKRVKNDELSTKSKLEYAKRALDNLKKVSKTFNNSLEFVRPLLTLDTRK